LSELLEWAACLVFLVVVLFFAMVVESEGGEERKVSREDGRKCGCEVKQAWEQASWFSESCRYGCSLLLSSVGV
jgi:hypothetical protein